MPSVLGLMEWREARARQDLESWIEVLEQAQVEVGAAQEWVDRARVGREERVKESTAGDVSPSVLVGGEADASAGSGGSGVGSGMGYAERKMAVLSPTRSVTSASNRPRMAANTASVSHTALVPVTLHRRRSA